MTQHLESICRLRMVSCPLYALGACSMSCPGRLQYQEMESHIFLPSTQTSGWVHMSRVIIEQQHHVGALSAQIVEQSQAITDLQRINVEQKQTIATQGAAIESLHAQLATIRQEIACISPNRTALPSGASPPAPPPAFVVPPKKVVLPASTQGPMSSANSAPVSASSAVPQQSTTQRTPGLKNSLPPSSSSVFASASGFGKNSTSEKTTASLEKLPTPTTETQTPSPPTAPLPLPSLPPPITPTPLIVFKTARMSTGEKVFVNLLSLPSNRGYVAAGEVYINGKERHVEKSGGECDTYDACVDETATQGVGENAAVTDGVGLPP